MKTNKYRYPRTKPCSLPKTQRQATNHISGEIQRPGYLICLSKSFRISEKECFSQETRFQSLVLIMNLKETSKDFCFYNDWLPSDMHTCLLRFRGLIRVAVFFSEIHVITPRLMSLHFYAEQIKIGENLAVFWDEFHVLHNTHR